MCTAIKTNSYAGRNLDVEKSYGEKLVQPLGSALKMQKAEERLHARRLAVVGDLGAFGNGVAVGVPSALVDRRLLIGKQGQKLVHRLTLVGCSDKGVRYPVHFTHVPRIAGEQHLPHLQFYYRVT